ncbi:hypothetical protein [Streptomyces sp. 3N207]|uniref:hypothetical protein n=1 Tax=Streptomyces sp. 3N207 TaxID=3457417 RepID=UPI003FD6556E
MKDTSQSGASTQSGDSTDLGVPNLDVTYEEASERVDEIVADSYERGQQRAEGIRKI